MSRRIDYFWRLVATGFSYALFGVGSALIWVILFPLISPFLGRGAERKRRARRLMHEVFRFYVAVMRGLGLLTYRVQNGEALNRPGRIVVANHPTLIDVVLLISMIRNATCIVKPALYNNPVMRFPIRAMDYLYAEDPEILLQRCVDDLHDGSTLIVFPQGTRTPAYEQRPFQRGAANIALHSGAPLLPVHIRCSPPTLGKHEKWYHIPPTRVCFDIHVGEEIDPLSYADGRERARAARALTRDMQARLSEPSKKFGPA
ncbi:1-acyl-sn-glycerol-3-phosphate acyltransferase [Methylococcus sp. EFPC2]|nr:1-acyl-sn-glycerol-3-phosphate acyltransferase [Methylococcus sp. EFPC2]